MGQVWMVEEKLTSFGLIASTPSVVGEVWMVEVKLTSFGLIARSAIV